tara:strand:- start:6946 stop:7707 length:762 start_codon:yes stop_codon:yes gene_type:complete
MISCLMPTYNRCPKSKNLLDEAVQSFLLQDYEDKELIICNDTPGQKLVLDVEGVRVFNLNGRFTTLSHKLIWMIEKAKGDILCRWDDDDICLPHRLSYSMRKLGDSLEWRAANYWYCPPGETIYVKHPGNTHCMALWRREVLGKIGGYPPNASGWEDQAFNKAVFEAGVSPYLGEVIPAQDIFYLYRWGVSPRHLSGSGGGEVGLQNHYNKIGERPVTKEAFELSPGWRKNYVQRGQEALMNYRKEEAVEELQ